MTAHPPGSHTAANERVAAVKIGCTLDEYRAQRAAGLRWCSGCRSWRADVHRSSCLPCRRRWGSGRRHQWTDATSPWMRETVEVDVVQRGPWGRRG